jgi:tetratricopeptide (TPR) repeat protein
VKAAALFEESLALHRELGIRRSEAVALGNLGFVARHLGEVARAAELFGESIAIRHELGDEIGLAHSFLGLAGLLREMQDYERAATLLGVTDSLLETTSVELALADRGDYEQTVAITRAQLAEGSFERFWARGYGLPTDRAVARTLELSKVYRRS